MKRYCDVTDAWIFALTRRRRVEAKAQVIMKTGGAAYWGSVEAAQKAAERYEAWRIEARAQSKADREKRRLRPKGGNTLHVGSLPKLGVMLFDIQDGCCYLTGDPLNRANPPTWEHVVPKAMGGRTAGNVLLAGFYANLDKADRAPRPCELIYLKVTYEIVTWRRQQKGPGDKPGPKRSSRLKA